MGSNTRLHLILVLALMSLCSCHAGNPAQRDGAAAMPKSSEPKLFGRVDACRLLTKEDVESFLAEPVGTPATTRTEAMGNTVTQCRYTAPSGNKRVGLLLRAGRYQDSAMNEIQLCCKSEITFFAGSGE